MTIDTKHLRELAEAATPGPWKASPYTRGNPSDGPTMHSIRSTEDSGDERCKYQIAETEYDEMGWRDATYIAAIDPPTLIALIDRLEGYRRWKAEARKHIDWVHEWQSYEGDTPEANLANAGIERGGND